MKLTTKLEAGEFAIIQLPKGRGIKETATLYVALNSFKDKKSSKFDKVKVQELLSEWDKLTTEQYIAQYSGDVQTLERLGTEVNSLQEQLKNKALQFTALKQYLSDK